jgi:hypothetical protein
LSSPANTMPVGKALFQMMSVFASSSGPSFRSGSVPASPKHARGQAPRSAQGVGGRSGARSWLRERMARGPAGTDTATTRRPRASDLVRAFAQLGLDEWQAWRLAACRFVCEARSFPECRRRSAGLTLPWACGRESAPSWICVCARAHSSWCRSGCSAPRLSCPPRFDAAPP